MDAVDQFRKGYVEAMLWANTTSGEDVHYQYHTPGKWWEDTPVDLGDADQFYADNLRDLESVGTMEQHGHDFALTRNGHGAGFWDRGYGDVGDVLTEAAEAYGEEWVNAGEETVSICQDCLLAYHNGEPHPGVMRDDVEALGVPEDDGFFSRWPCMTCDQELAGQRYDVTVLWK